jgi:glutamate racemase
MSSLAPIGIFDSGVGGLSVLGHIRERLPHEDLIYVADQAYIPYGEKTHNLIQERAIYITEQLLGFGVKSVVVACNTATAAAIASLRNRFTIPIVGMEPGLKPGVNNSLNRKVAILATSGTLESDKFQSLMERHADDAEVWIQPCPGWVELVEEQTQDTSTGRRVLSAPLKRLIDNGVDTLVLGCTHYPFLKQSLISLIGSEIQIIDTGAAVARQLERRLMEEALLNASGRPGIDRFFSSEPGSAANLLFSRLLQRPCQVNGLT